MIWALDGEPKENLLQRGARMEEVRSLGAFLWWIYETLTIFLPICFSAGCAGSSACCLSVLPNNETTPLGTLESIHQNESHPLSSFCLAF